MESQLNDAETNELQELDSLIEDLRVNVNNVKKVGLILDRVESLVLSTNELNQNSKRHIEIFQSEAAKNIEVLDDVKNVRNAIRESLSDLSRAIESGNSEIQDFMQNKLTSIVKESVSDLHNDVMKKIDEQHENLGVSLSEKQKSFYTSLSRTLASHSKVDRILYIISMIILITLFVVLR